jgi:phospholipid/cholesterol/gamma-HCH transport system substrate-binding protein
MRGVNVGRVMSFSMAPQGVRITLEIEGAWDIPSDSRSRLVSGGILGGRTVEIVEGGSPAPISGGGEIPGENVAGLLDFPADLGKDAQAVLVQIQNLLAEPTLDAIQGSATELQALLAQLSQLAKDQGREIAQLTASLNRSALGLEDAAGSGEDLARAVARADSALMTVNRTSEVVLLASASLQTILQRIEEGEGTLGQLSTNPALYETLAEALESIRLLTDDIRANPGRYVKIEIF